jgi:hypothetical protein
LKFQLKDEVTSQSASNLRFFDPSTLTFVVLDNDIRSDATTGREGCRELHRSRLRDGDQIIEDRVRDVLIKRTVISILLQVQFQRLQLEAQTIGNVGDCQRAEVGLSCLGAKRRELRADRFDRVVPIGKLVLEGFQNVAKTGRHSNPQVNKMPGR